MDHFELIKKKIVSWKEAAEDVAQWQMNGEKVVFSNGCFDLIHRGHIEYLAKSASLGQKMVIGLNSDVSVRALKGEGRPVVDEYARAIMMGAFSFVDLVVLFDEDTPYDLIKMLQPDFLVKGNDYKIEEIAGHDIVLARGGEVRTLELVDGYSTTKLIDRIKKVF